MQSEIKRLVASDFRDALCIDPFSEVPVDVDAFAQIDEIKKLWFTFRRFVMDMATSPHELTLHDTIEPGKYIMDSVAKKLYVYEDFWWDGASGGVFNTSTCRLPSLAHDIACDKGSDGIMAVSDPRLFGFVGYKQRHRMYRDIERAQGMSWFRSGYHYVGLIVGNKPYSTFRSLAENETDEG